MLNSEFAAALARLVADAEDAGLDPETLLAEIEGQGQAQVMRECDD